MQPSAYPKRFPGLGPINHTPKIDITAPSSQLSCSEMPTGMALRAGSTFTDAIMGQAPSFDERQSARTATPGILRQDCIQIEQSENFSRSESPWSIHYDCADQTPYSANPENKTNTETSLLYLPKDNPSHDLAFFLRTTGPNAPHRRPSKLEHPQRAHSRPKNALRFLKMKRRSRQRMETILRDEGGLLTDLKKRSVMRGATQKVSTEGTKYLALQIESCPGVLDSSISVSFLSDGEATDKAYNVTCPTSRGRARTPVVKGSRSLASDDETEVKTREPCAFPSIPIQPIASSPPTPDPTSLRSITGSDHDDHPNDPRRRSLQTNKPWCDQLPHGDTFASLPLPDTSKYLKDPLEEHCNQQNTVDVNQPWPKRFDSQPTLLQRGSSVASSSFSQALSDSPGPPPKSPLRLRRDPRLLETVVAPASEINMSPKYVPQIRASDERHIRTRATVTTDCTGPIKKPRDHCKNSPTREERTRARKLRDRPVATRTIDSVVNGSPLTPRQRLKKARPRIQIPDLRPAPFATCASSSASSNASWKKVTEFTRTPISAVPSEDAASDPEQAEDASNSVTSVQERSNNTITLSPVMLVAEEIPSPKAKTTQRSSRPTVKEGKTYAPRPRSASLPRSSMQRRSRQGIRTPTRSNTPSDNAQIEHAPPLPSNPPNCPLPPTPPASGCGSENSNRLKFAFPVSHKNVVPTSALVRREQKAPHVVTQAQRRWKPANVNSEFQARLEAVEKQNALLSAALGAVLRMNGEMNQPRMGEAYIIRHPMAWEDRIARRSAAMLGPIGNTAALDRYSNTRQPGSQHRHP